jgi:hypothetical protein
MVCPRGSGVLAAVSILSSLLAAVAQGGVDVWTSVGPAGAHVTCIAVAPGKLATVCGHVRRPAQNGRWRSELGASGPVGNSRPEPAFRYDSEFRAIIAAPPRAAGS